MKKRIFLFLFLAILFGVSLIDSFAPRIERYDYVLAPEYFRPMDYLYSIANEDLNADVLYEACVMTDVLFPEVVVAQAVLESGHFKSKAYREKNNFLGIVKAGHYQEFDHWMDCLKRYQEVIESKYRGSELSVNEYLEFLDRIGYAEDSSYIDKIRILTSKYTNVEF